MRAPTFYNFLIWDVPGGYYRSTHYGDETHASAGSSVGWLFFYDWDGIGAWSPNHVAIETKYGTDTNPGSRGLIGDLVTYHTTNSHNKFWSLRWYNQHWATTVIRVVEVGTGN